MSPTLSEQANEFQTFWDKVMAFMTPSTVRAIVLAFGTVGWKFTEGKLQAWLTTISVIFYIAFELFRMDSAQSAVNAIEGALKKKGILSILLIMVLIPIGVAHAAPDLCLEPSADVDVYDLDIDGTIIRDLPYVVWNDGTTDWHCIYDLGAAGLAPGDHTVKARAIHSSGMPGDWSVPLLLKKPGQSNQWKIRR